MGEHDQYGRDKFPPNQMTKHPGFRSDTPPWAIHLYEKLVITMEGHLLVIAQQLETIMATQAEVAAKVAALTQNVADEKTVIDSLDVFLANLSKQLADLKQQVANGEVPQAIADQIDAISGAVTANKARIIGDITTNTPAA